MAGTYLEAVDGEEAAEDALLEPRAQHDHVVLHVHGGRRGGGRPGGAGGREGGRKVWISNGLVDRWEAPALQTGERRGVKWEGAAGGYSSSVRRRVCHGSARKIANRTTWSRGTHAYA